MRSIKRLLAFALAFMLLIGVLPTSVLAVSDSSLKNAYEETYKKLLSEASSNLTIGSISGEWLVIGLARSQGGVPTTINDNYVGLLKTYLPGHINENGQMFDNLITKVYKPTENERVAIALAALGYNPTNFEGRNLLAALEANTDAIESQGNNALAYALVAYNAAGYSASNENEIISRLLAAQKSDGTWTVSKTDNSMPTDMTAMVIQGLSPYYSSNSSVRTAVDAGLSYLSSIQKSSGSIDDSTDPETSAQALVALVSVGVNPATDSRFIKNGKTLLDAIYDKYLMYYQGFAHGTGNTYNQMATEQAFYALDAYYRFANGQPSLYDMSDVVKVADTEAVEAVINAINAIPANVTLADKAKVESAKSAYDALTSAQQALVTNKDKLTYAEATIKQLEADKIAADEVIALIANIGEVTLAKEADITNASSKYNALTEAQKKLVTNADVLTNAKNALETLKANEAADKAAAKAVEDEINALLANITLTDKTAVESAKANFNNLTSAQKAFVSDSAKSKLDSAVARIEVLETAETQAKTVETEIANLPTVENTKLSDKNAVNSVKGKYDALSNDAKGFVSNVEKLNDVSAEIKRLEDKDAANKSAADAVVEKITAIGTVTLESESKINEAQSAYDALSNEHDKDLKSQQDWVTNYSVLLNAKSTFASLKADAEAKAAANSVIDKINAIGTVEYTEACNEKITAARNAYDALDNTCKALVGDNLITLTNAETTYADMGAAEPVKEAISAIGTVSYTDVCKSKIDNAREKYNALTSAQQGYVNNYNVLTAAEDTYSDMVKAAEVDTLIAAIGTVTLESESKITAAKTAYNALTEAQKAYVTKLSVLSAAEERLNQLKTEKADNDAAEAVINKIDAIGTVTKNSESKIKDARNSYNALTAAQKALVSNYTVLENAEKTFASLGDAEDAAAAKAVEDEIKSLPATITLADKTAVSNARANYNKLTDKQKAKVSAETLAVLTAAEARITALENAKKVSDKLTSVNVSDAKQATLNKIEDVKTAYNALSNTEKALVADYDKKISELETAFNNYLKEAEAEAEESLKKFYDGLDKDSYSDSAWQKVTKLYNDGVTTLKECKYEEAISAKLRSIVSEINAVEKDKNITVTFRLVGAELATQDVDLSDSSYLPAYVTWVPTTSVTVKAGSTVYDVYTKAMSAAGLSSVGANSNYVSTITAPSVVGGYALGEFTNGQYSGWMYTVNGKHPDVGLKDCTLKNGDVIIWHYINDYRYECSDWFDGSSGNASLWNGWLKVPDTAPTAKKYDDVIKLIDAIGTVSMDSKSKIDAARSAYDKLTGADKAKVTNYKTLTDAEVKYKTLKDEVDNVISLIGKIGTVTKDSKDAIEEARTAYDKLTDNQKKYVTNYSTLTSAEKDFENLDKENPDKPEDKPNDKPENPSEETSYKDVKTSDWFYDDVEFVTENKLFVGTGNGKFEPNATMTRSMLVTVLYRLEGEPSVSGTSKFGDVKSNTWYTDAVVWATQNGIIKGTSDTTFGTNDNITREQMATMLYRYAQFKGYNTTGSNDLSSFTDKNSVSSFAKEAIQWANAEELIKGRTDTTLVPQGNATRAEVAAILHRFCDNVVVA